MSSGTEFLGLWPTQSSYQQLLGWTALGALLVFYYVFKVIYRIYFSPLSHVPGRKLAGMSLSRQYSAPSKGSPNKKS